MNRALTYARAIADAQVQYARGHKAALQGTRPKPPADLTDRAAWWRGYTAGRQSNR